MQVLKDTSEQVEVMGTVFQRLVGAKKEKSKSLNDTSQKESNKTCKYCGKTLPMQKQLCPAYGKFFSKCGKPNQSLLYVIKRDTAKTLEPIFRQQERQKRRATNESETNGSETDEDRDLHFIDETLRHLTARKIKVNKVYLVTLKKMCQLS